MKKPLISIIVPVYNVEKYLPRGLNSILIQTFTDWEAILVDDGSIDHSGAICDEYAVRDLRFKVIHKPNGGVSSARNWGLEVAIGEYIYFSDADDELMPDCLDTLYGEMKEGIDLVTAAYQRYDDGDFVPEKIKKDDMSFSIGDYLETISTFPNSRFCERYLVTKLFRKTIIDDNHLRFDRSLAYREDVVFLYSYVVNCHNVIAGVNHPVYKYYRRTSGAAMTHTKKLTPHSVDIFFAIEKCYTLVKRAGLSAKAEVRLKNEMVGSYNHFRSLLREKGVNREYKLAVRKMDKSLFACLDKMEYVKMRIKNILRPAYRLLKAMISSLK